MLYADAQSGKSITEEERQYFLENGFLVIRNVIKGEELALIQQEMMSLLEKGAQGVQDDPDFMYGKGTKSGEPVLKRIEYVVDKSDPMKVLMGHPYILKSVELLQGRNFIPTWDSMVVKMPDEGIIVPWHRDAAFPEGCPDERPIFNVDFYLDKADLKSCLWVIPGSHTWSKEEALERCRQDGFDTSDAIPVPMEPGDVIFHDITVLHGSPSGDGNNLRRTIYYEFRPAEIELQFGPHKPEYIPLKQQVLQACLQRRAAADYVRDANKYEYQPTGEFSTAVLEKEPSTFRFPHAQYFR